MGGGGGIRPITDCSRPKGSSVNQYTGEVFSTFSFVKMAEVLQNVKPSIYMATVDLKSAYRSVLVHPSNRTFFGLKWNIQGKEVHLVDNFVCFGARVAPACFNRLTDAVSRMMGKRGYICQNYLDDFICYGLSYEECVSAQLCLIEILRRLGFYINWSKLSSPSKQCRYLGLLIDSERRSVSLPSDELLKVREALLEIKGKKKVKKKKKHRLCGLLAHASKVVRGGRYFSRRLIDTIGGMPENGTRELPKSVLADINWWRVCLDQFNGKACILDIEEGVFAAVIIKGDWFVCGVGEKCVWGSIEWGNIDIPEVLTISSTTFRIKLPECCRSQPAVIESIVLIYGVQHAIQSKGTVVSLCCKYRKTRNILLSAKVEFEWLLTVIHEFFWWSVYKDCCIESIKYEFQAGWMNEWNM